MKPIKFIFIILAVFVLIVASGCGNQNLSSVEKSSIFSSSQIKSQQKSISTKSIVNSLKSVETSGEKFSSSSDKSTESSSVGNNLQTENGISYTAQGYSEKSGNLFSFSSKLEINFSAQSFVNEFNRFAVSYQASSPLKLKIYYTKNSSSAFDEFFIEGGEKVFNGLIGEYLQGELGKNLVKIEIEPIKSQLVTFSLKQFSTEKISVISNDVFYLENSRFKVGVRLLWGGGICYFEDKQVPVSGLKNLINQADTGRLVQQSYYGTHTNDEYVSGNYNGTLWPYNPVQGGDLYQNRSRIIDVVVSGNSVYVKAQPQDWAQNNKLTPSYMENTYTLLSDYLKVDNRFIDFSGWDHPYADQELPAFYTVSYLDQFSYYNGTKPWMNDSLSVEQSLPFWGEAQNRRECVFPLKQSNTETWCSWTNKTSGYGIGLFVPNVDSFLAGRHAYNGSMDANSTACNYVAPVNTIKLQSYQALDYSYLVTTGTNAQIREIFSQNKNFASNSSLKLNSISKRVSDEEISPAIDFSLKGSESLLTNPNNTQIAYDESEKAVKLTCLGADCYVYLNYSFLSTPLSCENYTKLTVEYKILSTNSLSSYNCDTFICAGQTFNPDGSKMVRSTLVKNGAYNKLEIDLSKLNYFSGNLNQIRFDYFDQGEVGDVIYLKSFKLS